VKIKKKSDSDKQEINILKKRINGIKVAYKKKHILDKNKQLAKAHRLDKNKFWRIMNKSLKTKAEPNIKLEKVKQEFEKTFNEKLVSNAENEREAKAEVERLLDLGKNLPRNDIEIDPYTIESIISNMSNGKMSGHCGVTSDMIKCLTHSTKPKKPNELIREPNIIVKVITMILKIIFEKNIFPENFNLSIMLPIVKDVNKSKSDLNNIRPISISNYLANIYEKFVLIKIDSKHTIQ